MPTVLACVISAVVAICVYILVTNFIFKKSLRKKRAALLKEAESEGEVIKKEKILQAKEKFIQLKSDHDRQVNERNQKLNQREQNIRQQENALNQQQQELERKLKENERLKEQMSNHMAALERKKEEADRLIQEQNSRLEQIGGMSSEEAKNTLIENMRSEAKSAAMAYINETIEEAKLNLDKAKQELEEQQSFLTLLQSVSRQGAEALLSQLSESKKERVSPSIYPYAAYRGETCYLIGHSASSNSFLSFVYDTDPTHYWLHVKGTHGSHVIIRKANPTDEEITLGCELALLSSNLSSGEVIYCPHKNIRRGKANGQVILGEYRSAYIRKVSDGAKRIYQSREKAK